MPVDLDKLTSPFPREAIKTREGGRGKRLDYVEGHSVIHRLNDATDNCWDMTVRDITSKQVGENTLMIAHVALTLPGLGTREGLGVQMVHERGGEDLVKGCITDGLKKAATLFGVGLELYGPDYENGEVGPQPARQAPRPQSPQNAPLRPVQAPQSAIGGPPAQLDPNAITDKQRNWLPSLMTQKGVEDVSEFLWNRFGVKEVGQLNKHDASRAIDELQKWPNAQKPAAPEPEQDMFPGMPPADEPPY